MPKKLPAGIPKNARKVFSGLIFDVYHWRQKMFDGSFKIFEKALRPNTATVIAAISNKIIVQKQRQPHRRRAFYSLPGGRVDNGETPLQAAKRELREETGYTTSDWKLYKVINSGSNTLVWDEYIYFARNCVKSAKMKLEVGEKITNSLITLEELIRLIHNDNFRGRTMMNEVLKVQLDAKIRKKFKKLLFGK